LGKIKKSYKRLYQTTSTFPDFEKFGIVSQIRRASISVCSNIAEGSSRKSGKEQVHFYYMSFSSLMEVFNQLIISNDLGYLGDDVLNGLRNDVYEISKMLNCLSKSINK
jgi:four helix bundle protein